MVYIEHFSNKNTFVFQKYFLEQRIKVPIFFSLKS